MVAVVENNRVVGQAGLLQLTEVVADPLVHHRDAIVVLRPILSHLRRVRVIGREAHLGRVVNAVGRVDFVADLALMADRVVEDREERLAVGPVFPVRLSSALVPDFAHFLEVVILLGIIGAVVAQFSQVDRVHFKTGRQAGHAAHMLGPGGGRIDAGDDRRAGRGADRRIRTRPGVAQAALGQAVEIRRDGVRVAVAAQVRSVVLAGYPENVRQRLLRLHLPNAKRGRQYAPARDFTEK